MEVTSIKLLRASQGSRAEAPLDLTSAKRFIAPDDGNPDDETVMAVPLPEPVPPGGSADDRADMDRARAADLRPHRRHRELLLHRAVVSEARRSRGTGLELPPVPLEHGVLFRLRRLRCAAHRAARLDRRRHGGPSRRLGQRGPHHDPPVLPGGRSRLRMDDEPGLRGANRSLRTSDPSGSHASTASSTGAPQPGGPSLQRGAHRAQTLR